MLLHAEAVLDLVERPLSEIQFKQVKGDFDTLQGKWMLQDADPQGKSGGIPETVLKYAIEVQIPKATPMLGLLEPLLEGMVFEDVPANLVAVKQRVEQLRQAAELEEQGEQLKADALRMSKRPTLSDMQQNFEILAVELERCFGDTARLPTSTELRQLKRTDLEKAIRTHGGSGAVAAALGWDAPSRKKPKGYWDEIENLRDEIDAFIAEAGLPPGRMPAKTDFVRAGRYDMARAIERWGGIQEVADALQYQLVTWRLSQYTEWSAHVAEVAAQTGLSGQTGLFEVAARTYRRKGDSPLALAVEEALLQMESEGWFEGAGVEVIQLDDGTDGSSGTAGRRIYRMTPEAKTARRGSSDEGGSSKNGSGLLGGSKTGSTGARFPSESDDSPRDPFSVDDQGSGGLDADLASLGNPGAQVAKSSTVLDPPLDLGFVEVDIITGLPVQRGGPRGGPGRGAGTGRARDKRGARPLPPPSASSVGRAARSSSPQKQGTKDSSVVRQEIDEW
eukprot:jgi/Botrbrau1/63/Bobra.0022s0056.1